MSTPPGFDPQQPFQQPQNPNQPQHPGPQPYPPQYPQQGYPQQGYPQQGYPPQYQQVPMGYQPYGGVGMVAPARTNGLAVTSMVLGIVGIPFFCLYAIPSLLAVVFGGVALKQFKEQPTAFTGRGMAVAGLVLGIIGTALLVLVLAAGSSSWTIDR